MSPPTPGAGVAASYPRLRQRRAVRPREVDAAPFPSMSHLMVELAKAALRPPLSERERRRAKVLAAHRDRLLDAVLRGD